MADDDKPAKPPKGEKPPKGAAPEGDKPAKQGKPDKAPGGGKEAKPGKEAKGDKGASKGGKGDRRAPKAEKAAAPAPRPKDYRPRMKSHYEKVVRDEMSKSFGYNNRMQIPRIDKIVLNMGVGEAVNDKKKVDAAAKDLTMIAGQRAVITHARKSVANYKVRDGMPIGCKVTLRGDRMYEFLDRLVTIALPRVKDFRGSTPRASTAAATSPWASRSTSCSPRSTTTRSTRSGAST